MLCCCAVYYAVQVGSELDCSIWIKFYSLTIQTKATEQYLPVVLSIMLYKVVLTCLSLWMKS